jgi:hypothetical protein
MSEVFELRQYTHHPGTRDVLIDLFERHFLDAQEELGMRVLGHFRDADEPDRFVWFRSFPDMEQRREMLTAFYTSPIWREHRNAANATLIDSDDVLLLREVDPRFPFPRRLESPLLELTVYEAGMLGEIAMPLLETEAAENSYPRLPVRVGENVIVSFSAEPLPLKVQRKMRLEPAAKSRLR